MDYEAIIGLEIHIQAKTVSKMFSSVSAEYWGKEPNSCVDPVTLGLPGALPVPNKKAIEHAVRLAQALHCEINRESKFDRKNYFYPDLPKGYQISQYDQPIGEHGWVEFTLNSKGDKRKINITRLHLEEDTGKSIHEGNETLLDFNKAGVPLIEVVTEPEFRNGEEIDAFAKRLRQTVRYLGVSGGDMEKGQMRYELNISLRPVGETGLPNYKVEVKNIGSISLLQKVLKYEFDRQVEILRRGERPVQETRGTRDMSGATYSQRVKEEAADYRYFPEPDIPPMHFSEEWLAELAATIPALPEELLAQYLAQGMNYEVAETLASSQAKSQLLAKFTAGDTDAKLAAELGKIIVGELTVHKQAQSRKWSSYEVFGELLGKLASLRLSGALSSASLKTGLALVLDQAEPMTADNLEAYLREQKLIVDSAAFDLDVLAAEVVASDPTAKERFAKNPNLAMFFVGQIMRQTKGAVDAAAAKVAVEKALAS